MASRATVANEGGEGRRRRRGHHRQHFEGHYITGNPVVKWFSRIYYFTSVVLPGNPQAADGGSPGGEQSPYQRTDLSSRSWSSSPPTSNEQRSESVAPGKGYLRWLKSWKCRSILAIFVFALTAMVIVVILYKKGVIFQKFSIASSTSKSSIVVFSHRPH